VRQMLVPRAGYVGVMCFKKNNFIFDLVN